MGTDIHLFIEYRITPGAQYVSLTEASFHLPRNSQLFGALAGVRTCVMPLFAPRGFPEDASMDAERHYYYRIDDLESWHDGYWFLIRREDAHDLLERGLSQLRTSGTDQWISNPDHHHAGWLSGEETLAALVHAGIDTERLATEYVIVLHILRAFQDRDSRIVFWFDS